MDPPLQQLDSYTPPLTPTSFENSMFDTNDEFDFRNGMYSDTFIADYSISPQKMVEAMPTPLQSDTEEDSVFSSDDFTSDFFSTVENDYFLNKFSSVDSFQDDSQCKISDCVCTDHISRQQPMRWEGYLKMNSGDPCLNSAVVDDTFLETPQKINNRQQQLYQDVMELAVEMRTPKNTKKSAEKIAKVSSSVPEVASHRVQVAVPASSGDHEYCANIPDSNSKGVTPTPPPVSFKIEVVEKRTATVHATYPKGVPCGSMHTTLHSGSIGANKSHRTSPLSCVSTQSAASKTGKGGKRKSAVAIPVVSDESQSKVAKLETKAVAERNRRKKSNLLLTNLADTLEGVTPAIFSKVSKKGPSKKFVIDSAFDTLSKLKSENRALHSSLTKTCAETEELIQTLRKHGVHMAHVTAAVKKVKQTLLQ